MQFRDETGMVEKPIQRYIKALGRTPDHCFGNNEQDTAGSTLVHEDCFFVPVRERKEDGVHTDKLLLSTFSPTTTPELELDDIIVCYLQPTGTYGDHTRAARWTTLGMWQDAARDYVIIRRPENGPEQRIATFAGILDLSAQYGTNTWDNGIIAHYEATTYHLMQLIVGPQGQEFHHPLNEDPRLAPHELPREYRNRLALTD